MYRHTRGVPNFLVGIVVAIQPMSSGGSLQLPQAQSNVVDPQKPISLPYSGTEAADDKSAVKNNASSVPAPVTEQALSSLHGIVPTLQWV